MLRIESRRRYLQHLAEKENETREKIRANYPGHHMNYHPPVTWQEMGKIQRQRERARMASPWGPLVLKGADRWRWCEDLDRSGLVVEIENATAHVTGRRTTGYYTDAFQDEAGHGIVLRLPHRRGFLAAVSDPCNPGAARVDMDIADDADTAARWADSAAERYAEREREFSAAYSAGSRWAELKAEVRDERRRTLAIVAAARAKREHLQDGPVWDLVRRTVCSAWESIREARQEQADLIEAHNWRPNLREAFNDAAGEAVA